MSLRKTIFWLHFGCGLVAGLVIGVMAFTGVALAFEKQILALVERDVAHVTPPAANTARLPLAQLVRAVRDAQPDARPSGLTLRNDPTAAVLVSVGRDGGVYVDPYTGSIRGPLSAGWRGFFHRMEDWHRALGREGDARAIGRTINDAANATFLVLAVTGLYLWWPRRIGRLRFALSGRSRDWNWHNAVGVWCAPVLIVLTGTGVVMSYRWANQLVYTLSGSEAPATPTGAPAASNREGDRPRGPRPDYDALALAAAHAVPDWGSIVFRLGGPRTGDGLAVNVHPRGAWPRFAATQLALDPATGRILHTDTYESGSAGRKIRSWIRFLHTGEALGWPGQAAAALASLGGGVLVVTGLSLAVRRLFGR